MTIGCSLIMCQIYRVTGQQADDAAGNTSEFSQEAIVL